MWLLDVNIDLGVKEFLIAQGINCRTSQEQGWQKLTNGELVRNAFESQFRVLVTRDKLLNESAATTLKRFAEFGVVLLTMRQRRQAESFGMNGNFCLTPSLLAFIITYARNDGGVTVDIYSPKIRYQISTQREISLSLGSKANREIGLYPQSTPRCSDKIL